MATLSSDVTLADYREAVRLHGYDGLTDAQLNTAINLARRRVVNEHHWQWKQYTKTTIVLTAGSAALDLYAAGIADEAGDAPITAIWISYGGELYEVKYRELQDFRQLVAAGAATGMPTHWTRAADNVQLYPTPDKAYATAIDFPQNYDASTYSGDLNDSDPSANLEWYVAHKLFHAVVWAAVAVLAIRQRESWMNQTAEAEYAKIIDTAWAHDQLHVKQSDQVKPYWKDSYRWR